MTTTHSQTTAVDQTIDHPLDPLTGDEIEAAVSVLESEWTVADDPVYHSVVLEEPSKDAIAAFEPGDTIEREAFIVLRQDEETYEATVSITQEDLHSVEHIEGVQPAITPDEVALAEEITINDEEWREAAAERGVEDFDLVIVDPWPASGFEPPEYEDRRLVRSLAWIRSEEDDSGYARPIEGLFAFVDMDAE